MFCVSRMFGFFINGKVGCSLLYLLSKTSFSPSVFSFFLYLLLHQKEK